MVFMFQIQCFRDQKFRDQVQERPGHRLISRTALLSNYVAPLFNIFRINCTPQNVPGFSKQKRKKLVLRCVARYHFTEYIAGVSKRRVLSRG
jgi:hypothetical protein